MPRNRRAIQDNERGVEDEALSIEEAAVITAQSGDDLDKERERDIQQSPLRRVHPYMM